MEVATRPTPPAIRLGGGCELPQPGQVRSLGRPGFSRFLNVHDGFSRHFNVALLFLLVGDLELLT